MSKSFTLIGILVVIVVIGVLSAFILVGMSSITSKANIAKGQAFVNSINNSLLISRVSQWKFDEASGTTAYDSWNSNNGTLSGATTPAIQTSGCVSNNCLYLNGTTAYVNVVNVNNLKSSAGTISLWFKWTLNGYNVVFSFTDKDAAVKFMQIGLGNWTGSYSDESIGFYYYGASIIEFYYRAGHYFYRDNNWHNVTMTIGADYNYMYIDGQKLTNLTYNSGNASSGGVFSNYVDFDNFDIGSRLLSTGRDSYFGGYLDEIKIYNQAVPTSEIQQNYFMGLNNIYKNNGIVSVEFNQRIIELKSNIANNE